MADKISDLSGDEREQRIAELKRKMQESAKSSRAAESSQGAPVTDVPAASPPPAPSTGEIEATTSQVEATDEQTASAVVVAEAETPITQPKPVARPVPTKPSSNGSKPQPTDEAEGANKAEMNRREFFTYAWGGALGLLALEGAFLSFQFMMPRFKAGEFGGVFSVGPVSAMPASDADPQPNTNGKYWLVTTENNLPKALYMVCTHLGCLYQWVEANGRFECPCHGSKFTHDGFYIEGPAPRSLDHFEMEEINGVVFVDTGSRVLGEPAGESPAAVVA